MPSEAREAENWPYAEGSKQLFMQGGTMPIGETGPIGEAGKNSPPADPNGQGTA